MARKVSKIALKSWDEVDAKVLELGKLINKKQEIELAFNNHLTAFKEQHDATIKEIADTLTVLEKDIEAFAKAHRADFVGQEKKLYYGRVFFRKTKSITIPAAKKDAIIKKLQDAEMSECLNIKTTISKTELAKYAEADIEALGAAGSPQTPILGLWGALKVVHGENFYVEPKYEILQTVKGGVPT